MLNASAKLFGITSLLAISSFGFSQSAEQVLQTLQKQDHLAENASFQLDFSSLVRGIASHMSYEAAYSPTAFVVSATVPTERGGTLTEKRWEEQGCAISQVGTGVIVENPRPGGLGFARRSPEGAPQGVGVQFCEGRGLSLCRDPKVERLGADLIFTGNFQGKSIWARLDPNHQCLATEIAYLSPKDGIHVFSWHAESVGIDSNGFVYSKVSEFTGPGIRQSFKINRLQTGKGAVDLPHWFQPGCSFYDERVSPSVGYKSTASILKAAGGKEPSLAQLYPISLAMSREFAASKQQDALVRGAIAERTAKERDGRVFTVAATFLAALGLLVFGKRLLKGKIEG